MDPHPDFSFALELQLKDLGFIEERQQLGDTQLASAGSSSDRAYALRCMKEDILSLQRSVQGGDHTTSSEYDDLFRLSPPPASAPQPRDHTSTFESSDYDLLRLSQSPALQPLDKKCVSCLDEYEILTFTAPCNHGFCHGCTRRLILSATSEESQYPPRCCENDVPRATIRSVLNAEELAEYTAKALEYSTKSRLYCADAACATFIPPSAIKEEHGTCAKCGQLTHVLCRSLAHPRVDCPQDTALHDLLKVAEKKKWKRCSECRRMVELLVGCNHITCFCGHHFCYVCGKRWRTCRCAQWYEHRIILGPNEEVNDQGATPADDPLPRVLHRTRNAVPRRVTRIVPRPAHPRTLLNNSRRRQLVAAGAEELELHRALRLNAENLRLETENMCLEAEEFRRALRGGENKPDGADEGEDEGDVIFLRSNPVRNSV